MARIALGETMEASKAVENFSSFSTPLDLLTWSCTWSCASSCA
jgi:hypothetical protein